MANTIYTWLQVPAGDHSHAVCCNGKKLPSQFIPAPFAGSIAGSILTQASKENNDPLTLCAGTDSDRQDGSTAAGFENGQLFYTFGDKKVFLNDLFEEATATAFPPLTKFPSEAPVSFETFDGSEAVVTRAYISLQGMEKAAAYDFVAFKSIPLVQILFTLNPKNPKKVFPYQVGALTFDRHSVTHMKAGFPVVDIPARNDTYVAEDYLSFQADDLHFAFAGGFPSLQTADDVVTAKSDYQCWARVYDISEYGPENPFVSNILCSKSAIQPEDYLDALPCLYEKNQLLGRIELIRMGDLKVILSNNGHGLDLLQIDNTKTLQALLNRGANMLFSLDLRHVGTGEMLHLNSHEGWGSLQATSSQNMHTWIFSDQEQAPNVSVVLTAFGDPAKNRISWDMSVLNESDVYSVQSAEYPRLTVNADENTVLLSPYGSGEVRRRLGHAATHACLNYPGFGASMQCGALYNTEMGFGIYYGVHDPAPAYKICNFDKQSFKQTASFGFTYPFTHIDKAGNSSALAGKVIWQLFEGDWYDACMIYKEFVDKEANWLPEVDENGPVHTAEWMKTCSHWWRSMLPDPCVPAEYSDHWLEDVLEAHADLGVPSANHVYHWHQTLFDNEYPHFFPAKRDFIRKAPIMQQAGIKVVPYINSRCWDDRDGGSDDWEYTSKALPSTSKDLDGNTYIEISPFYKPNSDSKVRLAVMCPSSVMWQDLQCELVDKLYHELGVDGVYLDQIAAAKPNLCTDPHHTHAAGGGSWWIDNYNHMVNRMKTHGPDTGAFVTECAGEAYMKTVEALLSWAWVRNSQVPAFSAVYSGRVALVGRDYNSLQDEDGVKIFAAESFLFGEQMGWIVPHQYLNTCYREFYKKCVRSKEAHKEFFYAGQMLRPLAIESDRAPITTYGCAMADGLIISVPAVMGAHWKKFAGGQELIILTNLSDNAAETVIQLPDGITSLKLEGDLNETVTGTDGKLALTLPAQAVVTAVIG